MITNGLYVSRRTISSWSCLNVYLLSRINSLIVHEHYLRPAEMLHFKVYLLIFCSKTTTLLYCYRKKATQKIVAKLYCWTFFNITPRLYSCYKFKNNWKRKFYRWHLRRFLLNNIWQLKLTKRKSYFIAGSKLPC